MSTPVPVRCICTSVAASETPMRIVRVSTSPTARMPATRSEVFVTTTRVPSERCSTGASARA